MIYTVYYTLPDKRPGVLSCAVSDFRREGAVNALSAKKLYLWCLAKYWKVSPKTEFSGHKKQFWVLKELL